jgi:hypothetical protein
LLKMRTILFILCGGFLGGLPSIAASKPKVAAEWIGGYILGDGWTAMRMHINDDGAVVRATVDVSSRGQAAQPVTNLRLNSSTMGFRLSSLSMQLDFEGLQRDNTI